MAILCAAQKPTVNGRLPVSISPADCYGLPSMIWRDNAREDSSLRGADVYRLGVRLPRRREKLFTRKWSFDPCRLARALVPAATVSQPLQLRCHTGTLLLFQPLRIRLRVLLLLEKLVRLLPHRSWLLRLGRIAALSPVKTAVVDSRAVDNRKLIPWSCCQCARTAEAANLTQL